MSNVDVGALELVGVTEPQNHVQGRQQPEPQADQHGSSHRGHRAWSCEPALLELQAEVWSQIVNFSRVFVWKPGVKMTEVWREYRNMVSVRLKRGARKDGALFVNKARVG